MKNKINIIRLAMLECNPSKKNIVIDLRNEVSIAKEYKKFREIARWLGYSNRPEIKILRANFVKLINSDMFNTVDGFVEFFTDWKNQDELNSHAEQFNVRYVDVDNAAYRRNLKKSIEFYKEAQSCVPNFDMNAHIFETTEQVVEFIKSLSDPHDIYDYYVCRSTKGNKPVMFIMCGTRDEYGNPVWSDRKERHYIMAQYKHHIKDVDYMDARECSAAYWLDNPNYRFEPKRINYAK